MILDFFPLAPLTGQNVSNSLVYDQIPAKLMIFPSASAVHCVLCSLCMLGFSSMYSLTELLAQMLTRSVPINQLQLLVS